MPCLRTCSLLSATGPLRRRLRAEDGVSLVEVMVSAIVLIMVSIGVLGGIDSATGVSSNARSRSVATNLAQQDQERLRTLKAAQLSNLRETTTKNVGGVPFTIESEAAWVNDESGTESCTSGSTSTDYLRLSTKVRWPSAKRPVSYGSIFAPPNGSFGPTQGSVAVEVLDRADVGIEGLNVNLVGPPSFSDDTNNLGCAFFGFIPAANPYRAQLNVGGYVDPDGRQLVDRGVSVPPEAVTTVSVRYDRAASLTATFETEVAGVVQPAGSNNLLLTNAGLTSGVKSVPVPGSPSPTSFFVDKLFPFVQPYAVYAGDCASSDPGAANRKTATLTPAGSGSVTLRLPAIDMTVLRNGVPLANVPVKLTQRGTGCSSYTRTTGTGANAGKLLEPGLPYGGFDVCIPDGANKVTYTNTTTGTVLNNQPAGRTPTFDVGPSPPTVSGNTGASGTTTAIRSSGAC